MGYWRFGCSIEVDGGAYIDLNECVREHEDKVIKLFTDEDLKEELQKRKDGKSRFENRIDKLSYVYINGLQCDIDPYDAMDEIDNDDLLHEVQTRGLSIIDPSDISKHEIRELVCKGLGINEFCYSDEEIFEMLKDLWKTRIR